MSPLKGDINWLSIGTIFPMRLGNSHGEVHPNRLTGAVPISQIPWYSSWCWIHVWNTKCVQVTHVEKKEKLKKKHVESSKPEWPFFLYWVTHCIYTASSSGAYQELFLFLHGHIWMASQKRLIFAWGDIKNCVDGWFGALGFGVLPCMPSHWCEKKWRDTCYGCLFIMG